MDGTLLDSMPAWDAAGPRYLAQLGITARPGLAAELFALTQPQSAAYLQRTYALPLSQAEIEAGIYAVMADYYRHKAQLKPGAAAFLAGLRADGLRLAVATVTDRASAEAALSRLGVLAQLTVLRTADEAGAGKESPALYLQTAALLGTPPPQTLVFEDALFAARTAAAAGFVPVGVFDASSAADEAALRGVCRWYLRDFGDYPAFAARAGLGGGTPPKAR